MCRTESIVNHYKNLDTTLAAESYVNIAAILEMEKLTWKQIHGNKVVQFSG